MVLDNMRGSYYGRCPPFLVAALVVICLILMFNWWSLSAQNYDLIKQLEDLSEQLKTSSEEQDQCVRQRLSFEGRSKTMEEEIAQLRVRLEQQRADNDNIKKQMAEKEEELKTAIKSKDDIQSTYTRCTKELESLKKLDISKDGSIVSLRVEKEHLSSQIEDCKHEIKKLRTEMEQIQGELNVLNENCKRNAANDPPQRTSTVRSNCEHGCDSGAPKVEVYPKGLQGIINHNEPILPWDPPDAIRPKPSLSVTYLTPAASAPARGDHEKYKLTDNEKVENEDNNAAESVDGDAGGENEEAAGAGQLDDTDRMQFRVDDDEPPKKVDGDNALHNGSQ